MVSSTKKKDRRRIGEAATITAASTQVITGVTIDMPSWSSKDKSEQAKWDRYRASLKAHENGHVRIGLEGAKDIKSAINGATGTGTAKTRKEAINIAIGNLQTETDGRIDRTADGVIQARHDQYDFDNNHGKH